MSLYQRLGGKGAIDAVVEKFYQIMLRDDRVLHYFATTDMARQRQSQKQFITLVTGGPNQYQGADMKKAHCKHAIGQMEYDATWENLETALKFFNVPQKQINEMKDIFYSVQDDIVNKKEQKPQKKCPFNHSSKSVQSVSEKTLYQKLGGEVALNLVVNKFYDIMLQDSRVSHYFTNTDMQKQRNSQVQFISMVTGGPNNYAGKDMKMAHCPYKISYVEFDATWQNLQTALKCYAVGQNLIKQVRDIFYSVQAQIVNQNREQEQIDNLEPEAKQNKKVQTTFQEYEVLMPVTTILNQPTFTVKNGNCHPKTIYKMSENSPMLSKCPQMASKLVQSLSMKQKVSENQKRRLRTDIIKKQSQIKQPTKLSNCPYQKTYY